MNSTKNVPPKQRRSLRRRITLATVFVLFSVIASAYLFEWSLHTFDILGVNYSEETGRYRTEVVRPTWTKADGSYDLDGTLIRNRPNVDVPFGNFRVKTNKLGFRGPEVEIAKPKDTYRILMLGDSVVFGWGVNDAVTFSRRLERSLNEHDDPRTFEVINTGHLLYDTQQQLALLRSEGVALKPDLVILVYVVNDIEPSRDLVETLLGLRPLPEPSPGAPPPTTSALAGWFPTTALILDHFSAHQNYDELIAAHGGEYIPENEGRGPQGWERSKKALIGMRDLCKLHGMPFLLLDHSFPPIRSLPPFCEASGIELVPFRFTEVQLQQPIQNSAFDPHANPLGQEFLWQRLLAIFAAKQLPPR